MLGTETIRQELPHVIPPSRDRNSSQDSGLKEVKPHKRPYQKRKAAGLCSSVGCPEKPRVGHTRCQRHLQEMSARNKQRYHDRDHNDLCIYCGKRPQFWGVRCVICRQRFAKHPLPFGARRALRLCREAEKQREAGRVQVEARRAVHKLLATGGINGKRAEALRLYAGLDSGQWRNYVEVGKVMNISKQYVHRLLLPSKVTLAHILGDNVPWKSK